MLGSKKICLLGYSGHAYVVIDIALSNNYEIIGYFDKDKAAQDPYSLSYLGDEQNLDIKKVVGNNYIFPAIGSNYIRKNVVNLLDMNNLKQIVLIDASANISHKAEVDVSTLVCSKVVVNSMAVIGKGCIINTGAIIEHECEIGDFCHLAPGSVVAGNVKIGKNTFVGANATIKQGITIGNNVTIGAGAVVLKDIPDDEVWVGNPGRRIQS